MWRRCQASTHIHKCVCVSVAQAHLGEKKRIWTVLPERCGCQCLSVVVSWQGPAWTTSSCLRKAWCLACGAAVKPVRISISVCVSVAQAHLGEKKRIWTVLPERCGCQCLSVVVSWQGPAWTTSSCLRKAWCLARLVVKP